MAESIVNKVTQPFGGGVNPSSNATLHERTKRFFESVKILCHAELVSASPIGLVKNKIEHRKTILSAFIERFRMTKTSSFAKALAFTLAETLVVMGIIGVVAALTIPNLNQSTGDREKVAKVKKIYSNLEDALGRAQAVYGPLDEWFQNDGDDNEAKTKRFAERMIEFMKVSKNCGQEESGCFASTNVTYSDGSDSGESYDDHPDGSYNVVLADGTSVLFLIGGYYSNRIRVDIDGPNKGKNFQGIDLFDFGLGFDDYDYVQKNTIYPSYPTNGTDSGEAFIKDYTTAWVIQNGNLDYLKCPDELVWGTKTSCK